MSKEWNEDGWGYPFGDPDQTTGRRDGEDPFAFMRRLVQNEILEQCAKAVEARIAHEDALPITDDETIACAAAVRALKDE